MKTSLVIVALVASIAQAQAQTGLPELGVLLSGGSIINQSSHRILAFTVVYPQGNRPAFYTHSRMGMLRTHSMSESGFAAGTVIDIRATKMGPLATGQNFFNPVSIDAILFEDGRVVGPDRHNLVGFLQTFLGKEAASRRGYRGLF